MRRVLLGVALTVPLALVPTAVRAETPVEARQPSYVRLDGVAVKVRPGTKQVVTANRTSGHHARITLWARTPDGWEQRMRASDGRLGYGGLVAGPRRRQGTGTTPLGTYDLRWAFGTHDRARTWEIGYRQIRRGDYWVQDNASDHYNRYRNKRAGGFRWWLPSSDPNSSERLTDYRVQYEWSIVTGFNRQQVRYRGSGIFLHVNGSGATAGCVSAPRWFIKSLMGRLDRDKSPVIAIGR
jgi:L,D-peptidoglycan transpeptidase YkuD (ErfK/YbiS/YcfS/YnhG family)